MVIPSIVDTVCAYRNVAAEARATLRVNQKLLMKPRHQFHRFDPYRVHSTYFSHKSSHVHKIHNGSWTNNPLGNTPCADFHLGEGGTLWGISLFNTSLLLDSPLPLF